MKYERQQIRNLQGSVEYTIDVSADGTKTVRNKHGELLGRIVHGQTRDRHGNLVALDENVGLLMKGSS
ncbi:MAG: hypothetical protein HY717_04290 [Planctomycetes bacterium]|nr:hypothetical protein [Planctomycetota bacterium]